MRDVTNHYWWISEVTPLQISHNEVHQYSRTNERIQFVEELWLSNKSGAVLEPSGQLKSMQNANCQGYNGASNMSARHGIQGILSKENNKALYVHCNSHILNLCIVQACYLRSIRNMSGTVLSLRFSLKIVLKDEPFWS